MKWYTVDNDINDLEWMLKKYWVNNNTSIHYKQDGCRIILFQLVYHDRKFYRNNISDTQNDGSYQIQSARQVVVNDTNYCNIIVHHKQNECQVLLLRSTHQMVKSNDIYLDYGSNFGVLFRLVYQ